MASRLEDFTNELSKANQRAYHDHENLLPSHPVRVKDHPAWFSRVDELSHSEKIQEIIKSEPELKKVLSVLGKHGTPYMVGGSVRDIILGHKSKDFDIEVYGISSEKLGHILESELGEKPQQVGKQFGVFKFGDFDISLPRKEVKTGEKHTDFDVEFDENLAPHDGARRRDFTINALMYNPKTGQISDFFGGLQDLENKLLKHIDDNTFVEDALRVYRAAQFAGRFGFTIHPETQKLAASMDLSHLPPERLYEEFKKLFLKSPKPSVGIRALDDMGVLDKYFPEVSVLKTTEQRPDYHAEGNVYIHTNMVIDKAANIIKNFRSHQDQKTIMLAAFVHDFGKPNTTEHSPEGTITQHGHEAAGVEPTKAFLGKLTTETETIADVSFLVEHHLLPMNSHRNGLKDTGFRKMINKYGMRRLKLLSAVSRADVTGRLHQNEAGTLVEPGTEEIDWFEAKLKEISEAIVITPEGKIASLITGNELLGAGFKEGPELGKILRAVRSQQEDGSLTNKAEAMKFVSENFVAKSSFQQFKDLLKDITPEGMAARAKGLVPQTGDTEAPGRWIRPKEMDQAPKEDNPWDLTRKEFNKKYVWHHTSFPNAFQINKEGMKKGVFGIGGKSGGYPGDVTIYARRADVEALNSSVESFGEGQALYPEGTYSSTREWKTPLSPDKLFIVPHRTGDHYSTLVARKPLTEAEIDADEAEKQANRPKPATGGGITGSVDLTETVSGEDLGMSEGILYPDLHRYWYHKPRRNEIAGASDGGIQAYPTQHPERNPLGKDDSIWLAPGKPYTGKRVTSINDSQLHDLDEVVRIVDITKVNVNDFIIANDGYIQHRGDISFAAIVDQKQATDKTPNELQKEITPEGMAAMASGLVPQSGNRENPVRWLRPEEANQTSEISRQEFEDKRITQQEMLKRGADGHLSSAVELNIPLTLIEGLEPVPAMEGEYQKGTPITQPVEIKYDGGQFILYAGNHRVHQAKVNGDTTIPAFVEGLKYSELKTAFQSETTSPTQEAGPVTEVSSRDKARGQTARNWSKTTVGTWVLENVNKDTKILDYGAGKGTQTRRLQGIEEYAPGGINEGDAPAKPFTNVHAYDTSPPYNDASKLKEKYSVVMASNVLNVQETDQDLHDTLNELSSLIDDKGQIVINFPSTPRKNKDSMPTKGVAQQREWLTNILSEHFNSVKPIQANHWELSKPKTEIKKLHDLLEKQDGSGGGAGSGVGGAAYAGGTVMGTEQSTTTFGRDDSKKKPKNELFDILSEVTKKSEPRSENIPVMIGTREFALEMTSNSQKGLGGRQSLDEGHGMLFPFRAWYPAIMTMNDMQFPLDFIVVGEHDNVLEIKRDVQPAENIKISFPPCKMIIEVNAGEAQGVLLNDIVSGVSFFENYMVKELGEAPGAAYARAHDLVPKTKNWQHPGAWVRPNEADDDDGNPVESEQHADNQTSPTSTTWNASGPVREGFVTFTEKINASVDFDEEQKFATDKIASLTAKLEPLVNIARTEGQKTNKLAKGIDRLTGHISGLRFIAQQLLFLRMYLDNKDEEMISDYEFKFDKEGKLASFTRITDGGEEDGFHIDSAVTLPSKYRETNSSFGVQVMMDTLHRFLTESTTTTLVVDPLDLHVMAFYEKFGFKKNTAGSLEMSRDDVLQKYNYYSKHFDMSSVVISKEHGGAREEIRQLIDLESRYGMLAGKMDEEESKVQKEIPTFRKQVSAGAQEARKDGLVPQSGDWAKPIRWIRPKDMEGEDDDVKQDKELTSKQEFFKKIENSYTFEVEEDAIAAYTEGLPEYPAKLEGFEEPPEQQQINNAIREEWESITYITREFESLHEDIQNLSDVPVSHLESYEFKMDSEGKLAAFGVVHESNDTFTIDSIVTMPSKYRNSKESGGTQLMMDLLNRFLNESESTRILVHPLTSRVGKFYEKFGFTAPNGGDRKAEAIAALNRQKQVKIATSRRDLAQSSLNDATTNFETERATLIGMAQKLQATEDSGDEPTPKNINLYNSQRAKVQRLKNIEGDFEGKVAKEQEHIDKNTPVPASVGTIEGENDNTLEMERDVAKDAYNKFAKRFNMDLHKQQISNNLFKYSEFTAPYFAISKAEGDQVSALDQLLELIALEEEVGILVGNKEDKKEQLQKQDSPGAQQARKEGLVPESGDWTKPIRYIRPEEIAGEDDKVRQDREVVSREKFFNKIKDGINFEAEEKRLEELLAELPEPIDASTVPDGMKQVKINETIGFEKAALRFISEEFKELKYKLDNLPANTAKDLEAYEFKMDSEGNLQSFALVHDEGYGGFYIDTVSNLPTSYKQPGNTSGVKLMMDLLHRFLTESKANEVSVVPLSPHVGKFYKKFGFKNPTGLEHGSLEMGREDVKKEYNNLAKRFSMSLVKQETKEVDHDTLLDHLLELIALEEEVGVLVGKPKEEEEVSKQMIAPDHILSFETHYPPMTGYKGESDFVRELAEAGKLNEAVTTGKTLEERKMNLKEELDKIYQKQEQDRVTSSGCHICNSDCDCVTELRCECDHDCICSTLEAYRINTEVN
jgi:tRNA nucleotidyltransferase (CCA-adding enzyme)